MKMYPNYLKKGILPWKNSCLQVIRKHEAWKKDFMSYEYTQLWQETNMRTCDIACERAQTSESVAQTQYVSLTELKPMSMWQSPDIWYIPVFDSPDL